MKRKPVVIAPGDWSAVREDKSMGEEATRTPSSSSSRLTTSRRMEGESRGRAVPTFENTAPASITPAVGRSPPSVGSTSRTVGKPPLSSPSVSPPVTTPILPQEVNSRSIEKEVKAPASTFSSLPPTSTANTLSNTFFGLIGGKEKKETTSLAVDDVIALMDEEKEDINCFREDVRARGVPHEIVEKVIEESQNTVRKNKCTNNRIKPLSMGNEEMCDKEFLMEEDGAADVCDFLMRDNRRFERIPSKTLGSLAGHGDAWSLLELMMQETFNPVKITAWAMKQVNFNFYYPRAQIDAVRDKLPQGIVQVNGDSFIMGEALAEYIRVFKMVYTSELRTLIGAKGATENEISQYLGMDSLVSSLSMDSHGSPFATLRINNVVPLSKTAGFSRMGSPASSISIVSCGDEEVARLREQIRLLSTEMTTLKRDYNGLKERMEADKLCFSEHLFSFTLPTATLSDAPYISEPIELNGVSLILNGAVVLDSAGVHQLTFWCEIRSPSLFDASLISKCAVTGYNNAAYNTGPFTQIVRLKEGLAVRSGRHIAGVWNNIKVNITQITVRFTMKLVRPFTPNTISFDAGDNCVRVTLGEESLQVNAPYVSEWSSFLRAYFASPMKESEAGVYPIADCPIDDFREMLDVIYPTSKPIDIWNVERMLELADRFIMPMLTYLCEVFLNDGHKHNLNEIQMLILADKYNLFLTRTNVLEKLVSTVLLRARIIKTEGYGTLSYEMKRAVDARYVELDVQERG